MPPDSTPAAPLPFRQLLADAVAMESVVLGLIYNHLSVWISVPTD